MNLFSYEKNERLLGGKLLFNLLEDTDRPPQTKKQKIHESRVIPIDTYYDRTFSLFVILVDCFVSKDDSLEFSADFQYI